MPGWDEFRRCQSRTHLSVLERIIFLGGAGSAMASLVVDILSGRL